MGAATAVDLFRQALMTAFWLALPLLMVGFVVGIIVSLIQVVTSMQDSSFGTVPRLAAFLVAIVVLLPWMLARMMSYTTSLLGDFSRYAR